MYTKALLLVLAAAFSACGGSFANQWTFESADLQTDVTDGGDVSALVGVVFSAYGFEGRLEVGVDTAAAEVLICFVQDPDTDPLPICYVAPISRWENSSEVEEAPVEGEELEVIQGEDAEARMRALGMWG
jgi:hypothetical protein